MKWSDERNGVLELLEFGVGRTHHSVTPILQHSVFLDRGGDLRSGD